MSDPAAALHVPISVLRADLRRSLWLEWALLTALFVFSAFPVLISGALPMILRGATAMAEVTGPSEVQGTGRTARAHLPVAWTDAAGESQIARLPAPFLGPRAPGSRLPLLYLPEEPWRATLNTWLFQAFVVVPAVGGMALFWWMLRGWVSGCKRQARLQAALAAGRREAVTVTRATSERIGTVLHWRADDGAEGSQPYRDIDAKAFPPGAKFLLWRSGEGAEAWDDGWVQDRYGHFRS